MCVNINNVTEEDLAKLTVLLKDLNGENELIESESALGALLGLTALLLLAGTNLHLIDPDSVAELTRRAEVNMERLQQNLPPKMDEDWAKEGMAEQMGVSVEEVERYIQQQAQNLVQGGEIVPPGAYQPPTADQRPTINPPSSNPPSDGEDFRGGMYL